MTVAQAYGSDMASPLNQNHVHAKRPAHLPCRSFSNFLEISPPQC
jgi:hypothetical protein